MTQTAEFWEKSFKEKQTMWGFEPADSAVRAKDLFLREGVKDVLIPGIGYGRNAKIFIENGMRVTGIEISQTAIGLARENKLDIPVYHGSVAGMPFDDCLYGGIFCHALIHLLNSRERKKFIRDCYNQLKPGGYMLFSTLSKASPMYEAGRRISKDRFKMRTGATLFFYDTDSVKQEFGRYGYIACEPVDEPVRFAPAHPPMNFSLITCRHALS
jgi:SAM-dependent methyltransferase